MAKVAFGVGPWGPFGSWYTWPRLKPGDWDDATKLPIGPVRAFQQVIEIALPKLYVQYIAPAGGADGVFGEGTRKAVLAAQAWFDLASAPGVVDASLLAMFFRWVKPAVPLTHHVLAWPVSRIVSQGNGQWVPLWVPVTAAFLKAALARAGTTDHTIYSWQRDPAHNDAVSRATESRNKIGATAVDWEIKGIDNAQQDAICKTVGMRVGTYDPREAPGNHVDLGHEDPAKALKTFVDKGYRR